VVVYLPELFWNGKRRLFVMYVVSWLEAVGYTSVDLALI
jgi:hypothetical protein